MPLKLYKLDASPPARAVMMVCDIVKVPVEMIDVDILNQEHHSPEYLKKNHLHTVPLLEDGDLIIHDSHAAIMYLIDRYGKDDKFYPKDLKQRTLVNQKLFFNNSILFPRLRNVTYAAIMEGVRKPTEKQLDDIREAYGFLEGFLSKTKYLGIDHITLADIAAIATVTSSVFILPLDSTIYPKTNAWIQDMKKQPYCQKINAPGIESLKLALNTVLDL